MKRISLLSLMSLSLMLGCRTPDAASYGGNPLDGIARRDHSDATQEEIEENSRKFVENVKQQSSESKSEVREAIQLGQQEVAAWYQDQDSRHITEAKRHFLKAMQLQPKQNADAHHGLAVVADLEHNYGEAERQYQLALAQTPNDSRLLGNLGYSYLLQNRLDESERYLARAAQADPSNSEAIRNLGDVYAKQGRPGEAQATYARVMSPTDAQRRALEITPAASGSVGTSLAGQFQNTPDSTSPPSISEELQELRRLRDEQYRRTQQGQRGLANVSPQPGYSFPADQRFVPSNEQMLKQELAAIDREPYSQHTGAPVRINSQTGAVTQVGGYEQNVAPMPQFQISGQVQQSAPPQLATQPTMTPMAASHQQQNVYGEMSPYQQWRYQQVQQRRQFQNEQFPQIQPQQSQAVQMGPDQDSTQLWTGTPATVLHTSGSQNSDPWQTPWGGRVANQSPAQQYGSNSNPQIPQDQGHGHHYESAYRSPGQVYNGNNPPVQFGQSVATGEAPQSSPNAYEQATLEAARLGMGMGQSYSNANRNTPQMSPGANSQLNGAGYNQPERYLPTNVPPRDLSQAYAPTNSQGQQLSTSTPQQFGTASPFDTQLQPAGGSNFDQMQRYQQMQFQQQYEMQQQLNGRRNAAEQQLQTVNGQAWNQRQLQMHTPSPTTPGLLSPAEYGGMIPIQDFPSSEYPQRQSESADSTSPPQQERSRQPSQSSNGAYYEEGYHDAPRGQNIVVPPPYNSGNVYSTGVAPQLQRVPSHSSQPILNQVNQAGYQSSSNQSHSANTQSSYHVPSNSDLPRIIPGTR